MLLVWHAVEQDRQAAGFDDFAGAHAELLDVHALNRYYSSALLASPAARTGFAPPDLSLLPGLAR